MFDELYYVMRSLHCLTLKHDFKIPAERVPVFGVEYDVVFAIKSVAENLNGWNWTKAGFLVN